MNTPNKRKDNICAGDSASKRIKKECSYGEKCYRRNPAHFREFSHPHLENILESQKQGQDYVIPQYLQLQRHLIAEQLEILIEKQIYIPKTRNNNDTVKTGNETVKTGNDTVKTSYDTVKTGNDTVKTSYDTVKTGNDTVKTSYDTVKTGNDTVKTSYDTVKTGNETVKTGNASLDIKVNANDIKIKDRISINSSRSIDDRDKVVESSSSNTAAAASRNVVESLAAIRKKMETSTKEPDYIPIVPPTRRIEEYLKVVAPRGKMAAKHAASAPYHIFYTTITDEPRTHKQPYSITFQEILDPSFGELKCSLQINFMVEIGWLLAQYYFAGYSKKKLTILYGDDSPDMKNIGQKKPNVDAHLVNMATPFGKHHTKMMVLCYEDGSLRVVVSTANLYVDDWENRTQGLWISPRCPELPPDAMPFDGESPTAFKKTLLRYLNHYHLPNLAFYVERVKRCDFSAINVFLVASVQGSHFDAEWGLTRIAALLRAHCGAEHAWPLIAQASSLGSYGKHHKLWLTGDFLYSFIKTKNQPQALLQPPDLKLIYPSLENVRQSHDNLLGGGCLPYSGELHAKQPWITDFMYQWKAKHTYRDKAMPHIKSYLRMDPGGKSAAFYLLTSANISKAAWGQINKSNGALRLMSYEAGVLFLPQFVINKDIFPLAEGSPDRLIIPYDLPPVKFEDNMTPWVQDYLR